MKSFDYYIIPKQINLIKKFYNNIDILAIKIIPIKEFLDLILVLPVKICKFKGYFIISEDSFEYRSFNRNINPDESIKSIEINSSAKDLLKSQNQIFQNIIKEGSLFQFFKKYLKLDI